MAAKKLANNQDKAVTKTATTLDKKINSSSLVNLIFAHKNADFPYRIIIESMNQGAVTFTADGTILYSNTAFSRMVKMPLTRLIGSDISNYFKLNTHTYFKNLVKNKIKDQKHNFEIIAKDQAIIPVYVTLKTLELGLPHVVTAMIVTDLTETKRNEEIAANERLAVQQLLHEHETTQKAKELQYIMKERRALLASNKAKDEFISIASHQLRTPATSVKQYLSMLMEGYAGEIPEAFKMYLETAYSSNERQLAIIDELLKIAQIDSSSFTLHKNVVDISHIVRDVIKNYEPIINTREQNIVCTSKGITIASIDANEMTLVISNVIENASKYSPTGSMIKVTVERQQKTIEIRIKDQGVGIAQENFKKIFDKFTRIDNAMSDTVTGTGLGLYWVKRIVKLHKGTIKVHSVVNKGTTFIINIPYE